MNPVRIFWTPEMDAALRDLRANGNGILACADRIGVSHPVVTRRLRELDLPTAMKAGRKPGALRANW